VDPASYPKHLFLVVFTMLPSIPLPTCNSALTLYSTCHTAWAESAPCHFTISIAVGSSKDPVRPVRTNSTIMQQSFITSWKQKLIHLVNNACRDPCCACRVRAQKLLIASSTSVGSIPAFAKQASPLTQQQVCQIQCIAHCFHCTPHRTRRSKCTAHHIAHDALSESIDN